MTDETDRRAPRLSPNQAVELDVVGLAPSGDGIGQVAAGHEVHVAGALPGERVAARIVHVSRHAARAQGALVRVVSPSPARRKPPCSHQGRCTGCPLMIAAEESQRAYKRALLLERWQLGVDRIVHLPSAELGYRWSSKRVAGRAGRHLVLGSFRRRTHELTAMTHCLVDSPDIVAAAQELAQAAEHQRIEPYDEHRRTGLLRYAWFKTDGGGGVLVCLVLARHDARAALQLARCLTRPQGVSFSVQTSTGNVLRGRPPVPLRGLTQLAIPCGDVTSAVGPLGFLQPNPAVAALAYADLVSPPRGAPATGALALDLFAGAGATTALLRRSFETVQACEAYPESAALLGVAPESAEPMLARLLADEQRSPPDLVVANPPRAGLGPAICAQLNALQPPQLHVMSCNPAALRRDLDLLLAPAGRYELAACRAYDTLPQTPHVEVVAWLRSVTS